MKRFSFHRILQSCPMEHRIYRKYLSAPGQPFHLLFPHNQSLYKAFIHLGYHPIDSESNSSYNSRKLVGRPFQRPILPSLK